MPSLEDFDWLVLMGGPMSIHEEDLYPWLREHGIPENSAFSEKDAANA
jgi:GMP synthase-like glutamine amidotransferase